MIKRLAVVISFLLFSLALQSQDCIKGTVIDFESKTPLQGATIRIKDNSQGAITNGDGTFTICSSNIKNNTLNINHLGYRLKTISVSTGENILVELYPIAFPIEQVVVTATLNPEETWNVPAMVTVVDSISIAASPAANVDNLLRTVPGLFIDRSKGVFSKNASVTMRGLDGSNRVLILYDGTPLNKTSYGFINWSLISPDIVEQIEVVHGPSSALFGNNAMAGVINIRTKEPKDLPLYGSGTVEGGGFGYYGGRASIGGKTKLFGKDFRLVLNGFARRGDGYIAEPLQIRDSTNVPIYLQEKGVTFKMIVPTNDSSSFYTGGNIYADKRGAGRAVYMPDGSYDAYTTQRIHIGYKSETKSLTYEAYGFIQWEKYYRQNESLNTTGDTYRLFHTNQISGDLGLWLNTSMPIGKQNRITMGADLKHGWMDATDIYRTSTDWIYRYGKVTFGAIFLQDEQTWLNGKLKLLSGIRFDYASFYDGVLDVKDPTKNTGFASDTTANFPTSSWIALNPKLGLRYLATNWLSIYGSVSSGFMPAKLDDLCSSRKITKGFKLANPNLKPEHLVTYETGGAIKLNSVFRFDAALYYSHGTDFQYFVSTGDSIDTGGTEIKPIVKRENISSVQLFGGEFSCKVSPLKWLFIKGGYSLNHSKIASFKINPALDMDLTGNALAEVPLNQASLEMYVSFKKFANLGVIWTRIGPQWGDEINSYKVNPWNTFDLRIWREYRNAKVSVDVYDLFDNPYIDKKGLMSPGRYFMVTLSYNFGQ